MPYKDPIRAKESARQRQQTYKAKLRNLAGKALRPKAGREWTAEQKEKAAASQRGRKFTPEHRAKLSAARRRYTISDERLAKWIRAGLSVTVGNRRSSLEVAVAQALRELGVEFVEQFAVGRYVCDFFLPALGLVVEADGYFWHVQRPGAVARDKRRDSYLRGRGYQVLRLPEHDIKAGAFDALRKAVA